MRLARLEALRVDEVIVGKALYEGRFTLAAAHEALAARGEELMLAKRLIPCLDVDRGRVVKGVRFVSLRDAGDPVEAPRATTPSGADELVFLDITASSDARPIVIDMVRRVAEAVFLPFTVGGGVRSLEDAEQLLRAGADKVAVNTAAVSRPDAAAGAGAALRLAGGGARDRRARGRRPASRCSCTAAARRPARTRSPGRAKAPSAARARSCSPAWTATGPRTASTSR